MRHFHKTLLAVLVPPVIAGCNSNSPTVPQSSEITPARASVTGASSIVLTVGAIGGDEITQGATWAAIGLATRLEWPQCRLPLRELPPVSADNRCFSVSSARAAR